MAKEARGLICLALTSERCDPLGLNVMAAKDAAPLQTAFTVTIEAATGVSTGISMARVPDLIPCCRQRGLKMVTVADLIAYRRRTEKAGRTVCRDRPADHLRRLHRGRLPLAGRRQNHVAMVKGEIEGAEDVLVRVHSECLTGDVFHSMRCDCGEQLQAALSQIEEEGRGGPALPLPGRACARRARA